MNGTGRLGRGWTAAVVMGLTGLSACQAPKPLPPPAAPMAPEARTAMQSHQYAAGMDTVFAATVAVLQDLEWNLDTVDRAAGLIRASTARKPDFLGPEEEQDLGLVERQRLAKARADAPRKWSRWTELVIHMEPWPGGGTRQRIVMSRRGTLPAMSYYERQGGGWLGGGKPVLIHAPPEEQRVEVNVAEAYTDLFERIGKALVVRRAP